MGVVVYLLDAWESTLLFVFFVPHLLVLTFFYHFLKQGFSILSTFAGKLLKKLIYLFLKNLKFLFSFLF